MPSVYQQEMGLGLSTPINTDVKSDREDKAVVSAINLIQKNYDQKKKRDDKNRKIQDLFRNGFEVRNPDGTRKINSKLLQQAMWRTISRTKPLDFTIHGNNVNEEIERIVTAGIATILENGGYNASLRDKGGIFYKMYMWGDGFLQVGANPQVNPAKPVLFSPISNSNIYTDVYCTGVRTGREGQAANEMVVVKSMPWDEAIVEYPILKKKGGVGRIPRDLSHQKELERDYEQTYKQDYDRVEIAYYYNVLKKNYTVFAGSACTILEQHKGDNYPFVLDGEAYIPIVQFLCMPSSEGFYNYGLGDLLYDLALMTQRLMNMALGHVEDNTYPITMINVPKGEAGKFFNKLRLAHEMRSVGKKGYVALEYDVDNPNSGRVQAESLLTQNLFQEWNVLFDRLANEIKRLGINLDEIDRDVNATATQILAEEESTNAFIKQVMEYNASESKFVVDIAIDMIQKFVDPENMNPINSTTTIDFGDQEVRMDQFTFGAIANELQTRKFFVRIDSRSGAIPSGTMQRAQVTEALQAATPGSPAFIKLQRKYMQLHDQDMSMEDIMPQQAPSGSPEGAEGPRASGTERRAVTPRGAEKEMPAI